MRRRSRLFWVVFAIGASLIVGACVTVTRPKTAKVDRGVRVNHAIHAEQNLDCATCHEPQEGGVMSFPTHDTCSVCHEINVDEPTVEQCGKCHTNENYEIDPWQKLLNAELKWSHDPHVAKEIDCAVCHTKMDMAPAGLPAGSRKPACMDCHGKTDPKLNECSVCHSEVNADVVPKFRGAQRIQHDAPAIWAHLHGEESKVDPKYCALCHTEKAFCDDCHTTHPPDNHTVAWRRKTHGLEASWDRTSCSVCHEEDSCLKCHRNTEPASHRPQWGPPNNQHCVSCHYPPTQTNCTVCHESIEHQTAMPSPHRLMIYPARCNACHPGGLPNRAPHPMNSTVRCDFCH